MVILLPEIELVPQEALKQATLHQSGATCTAKHSAARNFTLSDNLGNASGRNRNLSIACILYWFAGRKAASRLSGTRLTLP